MCVCACVCLPATGSLEVPSMQDKIGSKMVAMSLQLVWPFGTGRQVEALLKKAVPKGEIMHDY